MKIVDSGPFYGTDLYSWNKKVTLWDFFDSLGRFLITNLYGFQLGSALDPFLKIVQTPRYSLMTWG